MCAFLTMEMTESLMNRFIHSKTEYLIWNYLVWFLWVYWDSWEDNRNVCKLNEFKVENTSCNVIHGQKVSTIPSHCLLRTNHGKRQLLAFAIATAAAITTTTISDSIKTACQKHSCYIRHVLYNEPNKTYKYSLNDCKIWKTSTCNSEA